jgi:uncharacterized protein
MNKFAKLPQNINVKLPLLYELKKDKRITALFIYGSVVENKLSPLSDIDIALLLDSTLNKKELFDLHLNLIGMVLDLLSIEEVDLQLLNTAPPRFIHNILKGAKLLFCNNRNHLIDFISKNRLEYLDFIYYKNQYNHFFQSHIGIK